MVGFKVTERDNDEYKSAWVSRGTTTAEMPWGHEIRWSGFSGVHGKTLFIKEGCRTSLKYNKRKSEVLMIRSGVAEVTFGTERTLSNPELFGYKTDTLRSGDCLLVQSCCPYRITAVTNCEIFEIGDSSQDTPVRIEDDYGREHDQDA